MTTQVTLLTPQEAFETLHGIANSKKHIVRVSREALFHLLIDHSVMFAALQGSPTFKVSSPAKHRDRPRLAP